MTLSTKCAQLPRGATAGCASTSWTYSWAGRPQQAKELALDGDQPIAQAMRSAPSTFRPYVSAEEMAHFMSEHKLESSPITMSDGRLVGLL